MAARIWIVGTSTACEIRVDVRTVSSRHCRLTERGEFFLIEDLRSKNGTYVAGEKISGPRLVRRGDPVTLGRNVALPWPEPRISITIGRHTDNDVVILSDAISGEHARLERDGDRVFLVDLGSTNGTAINDPSKIIQRAVLHPTDVVFLGTHRISAADLLALLPAIPPTLISIPPAGAPQSNLNVPQNTITKEERERPLRTARGHSPSAWLLGIAISGICVAILVGARSCQQVGQQSLINQLPKPKEKLNFAGPF